MYGQKVEASQRASPAGRMRHVLCVGPCPLLGFFLIFSFMPSKQRQNTGFFFQNPPIE
jgi:hypothetical protein